MKNVLVTGGAGFIGSNFIRFLLMKEPDVHIVNLDLLSYAGLRQNISDLEGHDHYTFLQGDVCDQSAIAQILTGFDIDTIVHFAAETHVDRSIEHPVDFVHTNVLGTQTMLECARKAWGGNPGRRRFHQVSTDEVYGDSADLQAITPGSTEISAYQPRSPYASSKAAADHLVRAYFHTYGLPVTISLSSNNYGPYQFPEKLIPFSILCALEGRAIPLYGDGKQIRDWVHVMDHCRGVHEILVHGRPGESYNIAGGNQLPNIEVVRKILKILDEVMPLGRPYSSEISYVHDRPGHDRRYTIDTTKIQEEIGWRPLYEIDAGLKLVVQWYLDNSAWLSAVTESDQYKGWVESNYRNRPSASPQDVDRPEGFAQ